MSPPRKNKNSRKDPKQKITYHSILSVPLHLTDKNDTHTQEKRLSTNSDNNFLAGGRRATDRFMGGLYVYWKSLSKREQDVLILVCRGLADAEIAARLGLSTSTVKSYLQHTFRKVQVRNRKQLMARFASFHFPRDSSPTDGDPSSF
jgi:DNA-binding CsgD family transcriptional regulator